MVAYVRLDGHNIKVQAKPEDKYAVCFRVETFWRISRLARGEAEARLIATQLGVVDADEIVIAPLHFEER